MSEEDKNLPYLYWTPNLHKIPFKNCFIGDNTNIVPSIHLTSRQNILHTSQEGKRQRTDSRNRKLKQMILSRIIIVLNHRMLPITLENNQEQNSNITVEDNVDQQRNVCGAEANNVKQDTGVEFDEEALAEMIETIKLAGIGNYEQYIKVEVQERKYLTRKDRNVDDIEIKAANRIMEEKIKELGDNISLWHINVMQYTTAITLLERHGKLREKRSRKVERKEPGWMINVTNRITAIRRKIAHVNLILIFKLDGKYTPKQKFIQKKLTRIYGSTTKYQYKVKFSKIRK